MSIEKKIKKVLALGKKKLLNRIFQNTYAKQKQFSHPASETQASEQLGTFS